MQMRIVLLLWGGARGKPDVADGLLKGFQVEVIILLAPSSSCPAAGRSRSHRHPPPHTLRIPGSSSASRRAIRPPLSPPVQGTPLFGQHASASRASHRQNAIIKPETNGAASFPTDENSTFLFTIFFRSPCVVNWHLFHQLSLVWILSLR